jgi:hypothetical protein
MSYVELERDNARLREQIAMLEQREMRPDDMGIAGRIALTRLRDTDYPELVKGVEALPTIYEARGYWAALAYSRTHLRTLLEAILVSDPRTPDMAITQHRMRAMLNEGEVDVMFRRDQAGVRSRMEFLEVVALYAFSPSVRAAFAKGVETPFGLAPTSFNRE